MGSLFKPDEQVSTSTSTNELYQQAQIDNLLGAADDWLASGGLGEAPSYLGDMQGIMQQMGQGYMDMLSGAGTQNRYDALQALNQASADQAANALGGQLSAIGLGSSATGGAMGSRRGVAEGVATAQANRDLASQQAMQNQQFLQQEEAIRQQGLAGLGNMFGMTNQLQGIAQGQTAGAKQLQNLLAYQGLISGNMGGTQTTTGTASGGGPSAGSQILGAGASIIGGLGAGGFFGSDENLKKNIEFTGEVTESGIRQATWEWNDAAKELYGYEGSAFGVIAQEVAVKYPEAVIKDDSGFYKVNYDMIGAKFGGYNQ